MSVAKERLHDLIDLLPEAEEIAALHYLEYLTEDKGARMARLLANAPIDDEPLSEDDVEAIREGKEDLLAGRWMSTEELLRALEEE